MTIEYVFECGEQVDSDYCEVCDHTIFDLSHMTDEAVETLLKREDKVCARGIRIAGVVMTKSPKLWKTLTVNAVLFSLAACDTAQTQDRPIAIDSGVAVLQPAAVEVDEIGAAPTQREVSGARPQVTLEDALDRIGELQAQRNQRHNLIESGPVRQPRTLENTLVEVGLIGRVRRRTSRLKTRKQNTALATETRDAASGSTTEHSTDD